jgi:hypothetical protein
LIKPVKPAAFVDKTTPCHKPKTLHPWIKRDEKIRRKQEKKKEFSYPDNIARSIYFIDGFIEFSSSVMG